MEDEPEREGRGETFSPDLIHAIFKHVWSRRTERGGGVDEAIDVEPAPETSRRSRSTTANASALQVSCELLRMFVAGLYYCRKLLQLMLPSNTDSTYSEFYLAEAVQRSAVIAEAEGTTIIKPTHLERVLPQLLLDF
ncbi:hypothetical protein ACQ4PT_054190 [Festuca glaucescens]